MHTMISTSALNSGVICELMWKMTTARSSVESRSAPTTTPARLNLPPSSLVPPRTTTMIASSSFMRPMLLASAAMVGAP
ncbi:hypothetical protein D3C74_418190 [compost metagenome]